MVRAGRECGLRSTFVFLRWETEHVCLLTIVGSGGMIIRAEGRQLQV